MMHEEQPADAKKESALSHFFSSALAGGAFGLVISIVFLLTGASDVAPPLLISIIVLLTAVISGVAGMAGGFLDNILRQRAIKNHAKRTAVIFLIVSLSVFGIAALIISRSLDYTLTFYLQEYVLMGMFLGLLFGALFTYTTYRQWKVQQKILALEQEKRYLEELAEKNQLLQEAARNLAVAEQRNNMARELHDSISQGMHGIVYSLHSLRRLLDDDSRAGEILTHLEQTTQATLQELRHLVTELTPSPLEDNGLVGALQLHCDLFSRRQQLDLELKLEYSEALLPEQEMALYRITQEALANIAQHASAGRVEVFLQQSECRTLLTITDDGCGFDPDTVKKGVGLANMAARARQNGGEFCMEAKPGQGTSIKVTFSES